MTAMIQSREHIISHDGRHGELAYAMECLHCGEVQKVATPMNLDCWVAVAKMFTRQHKRCKPKEPR